MKYDNKELIQSCKKKRVPYAVSFELTPLCNFSCNMCYVRLTPAQAAAQGRMLTAAEWISLAQETARLGTWSLILTGGEVFTRPDFSEIYEAVYDMGFLLTLRTNGYLLDDSTLALLKKKKPGKIMITFYGANDRTYQQICGVRDGFTVVSRNIDRLLENGLTVCVTMTVTTQNKADIEALKAWCFDRGLKLNLFRGLSTPNEGTERSIDGLFTRPTDEECEISDSLLAHNSIRNKEELVSSPFSICKGYGATYDIGWSGKMTLCNTLLSIWENPFETTLLDAYRRLYQRLDQLKRPEKCKDCRVINFCLGCPAKLYSETRNTEETTEEVCRIARYRCKFAMLAKQGSEEQHETEI